MTIKLSKREREILELAPDAADYKVIGWNCKPPITNDQVSVHMSHIRRKEAIAKAFLRELKPFQNILHPKKHYKGIKH